MAHSNENDIYELIEKLYPIYRSITGNGVRETLSHIKNIIPINICEIDSGTNVYDWKIPKEWNIKTAYIKDMKDNVIVDFSKNNLHVVGYSSPFKGVVKLSELKRHIFTLESHPDWIPYRTSYYCNNYWGFCMKHNDFINMNDEEYKVYIDSEFKNGSLTYADLVIPGKVKKEIILSSYICHPAMCNDSLSGVSIVTFLAKYLMKRENYYTYRIIFVPETIGSVAYLSKNLDHLKANVIGGYVVTCTGDAGNFTYLKTRKDNQITDKVTIKVLDCFSTEYRLREFLCCGSDERQYNFPGIDLNIGSLMKSKYHEYDEYHTSADDLNFIKKDSLCESYNMYINCITLFEKNHYYKCVKLCEPFLSKYNLYSKIGGVPDAYDSSTVNGHLISKFIKYCDGNYDVIDVSNKLNISLDVSYKIIDILLENDLIKPLEII